MSESLFEALMKFCPRCGKKLAFPKFPASCRFCGWRECVEDEEEGAAALGEADERRRPGISEAELMGEQ